MVDKRLYSAFSNASIKRGDWSQIIILWASELLLKRKFRIKLHIYLINLVFER